MWEDEEGRAKNMFWIWVGIEISDHPNATDGSEHEIVTSVSVADIVVTGNIKIRVCILSKLIQAKCNIH